ncbi:MAG: hypothetical protein HY037_06415 [Nitrospirae bacterium]|nr:hypothetical protein [Candidatus Troglogloeales bacterium]
MKRQRYFLTGVLLITAALYGCGKGNVSDVADLDSDTQHALAAIENPFETLGTTDEMTAFDNDPDIVGTDESSTATSLEKPEVEDVDRSVTLRSVDEAATSTDLACASSTDLETYGIRVRWGHFEKPGDGEDSSTSTVMDWSGSLTASSGQLTLIRTILFENNGTSANRDQVQDQTDPTVLSFTSHTTHGYDGLLVRYQHCQPNTTDTLTFAAPNIVPAFSKTWTLAELMKLNEIDEDVDANHDLFLIQSLRRDDQCEKRKGTINGVFFKVNERFGQIKGRVVSSGGDPVGHIKGFYAVKADENGDHKFVAKFIAHDGKFKGILIGTGKDGAFTANIFNRDKVSVGTVTGRYVEGDASHKGVFGAIYELDACPIPATISQ